MGQVKGKNWRVGSFGRLGRADVRRVQRVQSRRDTHEKVGRESLVWQAGWPDFDPLHEVERIFQYSGAKGEKDVA